MRRRASTGPTQPIAVERMVDMVGTTARVEAQAVTRAAPALEFVQLPPAPARTESTCWTSQGYQSGAFYTSAGVRIEGMSEHLRTTVPEWDAPAALRELEAKLLAALADVRSHEHYGITSVILERPIGWSHR